MNAETLENLAVEYALKGEWKRAIEVNSKLISLQITGAGVYNRLGKAYLEIKDWKNAVKSFKKALEIDPINTVAIKGLENAKNKKIFGGAIREAHTETLINDSSTSQIIELHLKNPQIDALYYFIPSKKPLYFLLVRSFDNKKIKRVSRAKLNLKSSVVPDKIDAKIIEIISDKLVKIKLKSEHSIFKTEKQQTDPSLEIKPKKMIEEKREIQKYYDEERDGEAL